MPFSFRDNTFLVDLEDFHNFKVSVVYIHYILFYFNNYDQVQPVFYKNNIHSRTHSFQFCRQGAACLAFFMSSKLFVK